MATIDKVILTTEEVTGRYQWSAATLWRRQRAKANPFPLPDIPGAPNRWYEGSIVEWDQEQIKMRKARQPCAA